MADEKPKSYGGNRWNFHDPVTMSFVCEARFRDRVRRAAKAQDKAISEFIRDAIEKQL
jgi:hypothetical protein